MLRNKKLAVDLKIQHAAVQWLQRLQIQNRCAGFWFVFIETGKNQSFQMWISPDSWSDLRTMSVMGKRNRPRNPKVFSPT